MYDVCKQRRILPTAVTSGFEARCIKLIGDQRVLKILSRRFKPRIGLEVGVKLLLSNRCGFFHLALTRVR